jgi:hypothetical protein
VSQLVKTKLQANFKDFKRVGDFKGLVEQKNVLCKSFGWAVTHPKTDRVRHCLTSLFIAVGPPNVIVTDIRFRNSLTITMLLVKFYEAKLLRLT